MGPIPLVASDIEMGRELLKILDEAGFPVTGAAWIFFEDVNEWRLMVRSPKAERDLQGGLRELVQILDAKGDLRTRLDLSRVKLVPPKDRLLAAMGSMMRVSGTSQVKFTRNVIDGILVNDALIYRLAA